MTMYVLYESEVKELLYSHDNERNIYLEEIMIWRNSWIHGDLAGKECLKKVAS